ncbi:MAG: deoxyribonuclease IV [Patescibacteria group bacterium]|nr:deoxyribonuclease IV [Patescibacteria group bacterium]
MKIGCHVSIAKGVENAPERAAVLGCEVFQIFTRSPQGGRAPELNEQNITAFKSGMKKYHQAECLVHTPYFINYGSGNGRIFYGSVSVVRQELERASALGAAFVVTHLGSFKYLGQKKGFAQLILGLEKTLKDYQGSAQLLLENSAGAGDIIGDSFEEIAAVVNHPLLKKFKLGVCFDTCHAFASGYDLRTPTAVKKTLAEFDETVGLDKLRSLHLNDSKFPLSGRRDRHEHIGSGHIGKNGFADIINHPKLKNVNGYLETEHDRVEEDIAFLKELRK